MQRTTVFAAVTAAVFATTAGRALPDDWPMWGGDPQRNMVNTAETNIPSSWDIETGKNIKWTAQLGSQAYGNPAVAGGKVFVGTNNEAHRRPGVTGDKGVILCFRESDGRFLWQMTHDKLAAGRVNDWPRQGICSSPAVEGDRLYYVSNRCELVCADTEGFLDGENDGPFTEETLTGQADGDVVWKLDMMWELGVFPHNLATSSPVIDGDLVFICTSNGVDEGHKVVPVPDAPSFIAVNKRTGQVAWEHVGPGEGVLHGQWSSPAVGVMGGVKQIVFPGGDGRLYAYEPNTGKLLWTFQCNPEDSVWKLGGLGTRNNIIATPVIHDDRVFVSVGQDPEHGEGPGHLYAVDGTKRGDITKTGAVWHNDVVQRAMSTVAVHDGIVYFCDLAGFFRALDAKTGKTLWQHDLEAAVWSSPYVVDGKVFVGDEDGDVVVFQTGREQKVLFETNFFDCVYTTPVAANGALYITNRTKLFAIQEGAQSDPDEAK
jgi:outer membrane protein assembly factor BamB